MKLRQYFAAAKNAGLKLFIPYITCGDPSLQATKEIVIGLTRHGADMLELGVPYNDPSADGPINQRSSERALLNNVTLLDCCSLVKDLRQNNCHLPIILFTYFNPVFKLGIQAFAALAKVSGINAVLVVDLPFEESDELRFALQKHGVEMIFLVSPTTSETRICSIARISTAFIYYISRHGTTGIQGNFPSTAASEIKRIREITDIPISLGFGISTPDHARMAAEIADGVIIGSALVKVFECLDKENNNLFTLASAFSKSIKSVNTKEYL